MAAGTGHSVGAAHGRELSRRNPTATRASGVGCHRGASSRRSRCPNPQRAGPGSLVPSAHKSLLHSLLLLLQLLLLLCPETAADSCPAVCRCNSGFIYCNDRGLTAVPSGLPRDATTIYLQNNRITNAGLPAMLQALSSVEVLYLYDNQLEEFPAHLPPNLRELHLQENNIEVVPGVVLERTPFLEKLHLNDNSVSSAGIEPATFHGTPRLKLLFLSRNHLSSVPRGLPRGLEELRLDDNRISRIPDRIFGQLTYLSRLALDGNILGDASISASSFSGLPSLTELSLARNVLTTVPTHLPMLGLQKLILQDNQISRLPPGVFYGLKQLQRIDLSGNGLRSLSQGSFNGLESLSHLSACNNPWHCDCGLIWLRNWLRSRPNVNARGLTCQTPERFKGTLIRDFGLKEISCIGISKGMAPAGMPPMPLATVLTEADDFSSTSSSVFTYGREGGGGGHAKVISSSSRIHVPGTISAPMSDGTQLVFSPCPERENSVRLHWQDAGARSSPTAAYRVSWVRLGLAARGAGPPPSASEPHLDSHEATVLGAGEFLIANLEPRSTYRICATPLPHAKGAQRRGQFAQEQGTAEERPADGTCVNVDTTRLQKAGARHPGKGPAAASSAVGPGGGGGGGEEQRPRQQQPSLLPLAGMVGGAVAAALFVALLAAFCWYVHHHHRRHGGSRRSAGQPLYGRAQQRPARGRGHAWSQGGRRQSWSRGRAEDGGDVGDEDEEDNDERAEVGYYEPATKPGGGSILEICETRFEAVPLNEPCCAGVAKSAYAIRTIFPPARGGELMVYQRDTSNSSNSSNRSYRDSGIPDSDYSHT
ncbi:leucine-rich repeat transmembrane protein FLRT3-like [Lampetra fluviatilis]